MPRIRTPIIDGSWEPGTTGYVPSSVDYQTAAGNQTLVPRTPTTFYAVLSKDQQYITIYVGQNNSTPGPGFAAVGLRGWEYRFYWFPASLVSSSVISNPDSVQEMLETSSPFASLRVAAGGGVQQLIDADQTHLLGVGWYFCVNVSQFGVTSSVAVCRVPYNGSVWESVIPPDVTSAAGSWAAVSTGGSGTGYRLNLAFYSPASTNSFSGAEVFVANYGTLGATPHAIGFVSCAPGGVTYTRSTFVLPKSTATGGDPVDVYICSVSTLGNRKEDPTTGVHLVVNI